MRFFVFFAGMVSAVLATATTGTVTAIEKPAIHAQIEGAAKGMSAIILKRYEGGETIIRQCVVTGTRADRAELSCQPFELFEQPALPRIKLAVEVGDPVVLRPLGQSATVIAPTASRYVRVLDRFRDYRFIHPDLFAAELRMSKTPVPKREEIQRFCDRQLVGTLIFALSEGDYVVDCQSLATLAFHADTPVEAEPVLPFFNRLEPIKRGFFSWGKPKRINDFDKHYRDFVTKDF